MKNVPTFQEFKRSHGWLKTQVPEVVDQELCFLAMFDFYDGPLEGLVEWKEKKYRYEVVSDFVNERKRYFALLELNDEEYQNEMDWHSRFEEYIGQGQKANRLAWNKDLKAYKKQCKSIYGNKKVAAWFCMY